MLCLQGGSAVQKGPRDRFRPFGDSLGSTARNETRPLMLAGPGRRLRPILFGLAGMLALCAPAKAASPYLLIEAKTGRVILEQDAGRPWHPASLTKLMTTYVTFRAVRDGRVNLYSLLTVSARAATTPPSKAGFKPGTQITIDNALKLLMVKSANDMAVAIAEGVGGSVEDFVSEMNITAQRLGMTATRFTNPHGLPDENQVSTARDMAILAQAIVREFPEHEMLFRIPALVVGKRMLRNHNRLIDRYPGADGMKTGFICASGFNLVATAKRNGRQLIAVVFGSMTARLRAEETAMLFERGFQTGSGLEILLGGSKTVAAVANVAQDPANLYDLMCGKDRKKRLQMADGDDRDDDEVSAADLAADPLRAFRQNRGALLVEMPPSMAPIRIFTGPARDAKGRVVSPGTVATRFNQEDGEDAPQRPGKTKAAAIFAPFPAGFGPQAAEPEKPIKLPRRAPMPHRRPAI
jgi:D-alanyl-D-alanine carboxypeptidase